MLALHDRAWTFRERLAARLRRLPWWLVVAAGAVSIVAGVLLLFADGDVVLRLRLLIGLGFLLSGIDDLSAAFTRAHGRVLSMLSGLLAVAAGAAMCSGSISADLIVLLAALVYFSSGMSKLMATVRDQTETPRIDLVFGLLDLALAALCAFLPTWGIRALTIVLGLRSVIVGARIIPLACTRLRRAQHAARMRTVGDEQA